MIIPNTADPSNRIDVLPDDLLRETLSITKRLDAAWSAGDSQGMLDAGVKQAARTYHLFKITDGMSYDVLASLAPVNPLVPVGWSKVRSLGAILTDGSGNIRPFRQYHDAFYLPASITCFAGVNTTPSIHALAENSGAGAPAVPFGCKVEADILAITGGAGDAWPVVTDPDLGPPAYSVIYAAMYRPPGITQYGMRVRCWTNASAQLYTADTSSGTLAIRVFGWRDPRVLP